MNLEIEIRPELKLLVLLQNGCSVCIELVKVFKELDIKSFELSIEINFLTGNGRDFTKIGLMPRVIPTVLAYKNGKLRLGWEGFAALAPDEIKREMVEDVLRQVAALADEDEGAQ